LLYRAIDFNPIDKGFEQQCLCRRQKVCWLGGLGCLKAAWF
jgi:hypothetical protein